MKNEKKELVNLQDIQELIEIVLYTGYIKNEKPSNIILIAKVESGKTELVKKYKLCNGIAYITDVTAYGIIQEYATDLQENRIKHIIIPDLLNPLMKMKSTVNSFVTFMNTLIEDGIFKIRSFAINVDKVIEPIGFIGCITKNEFESKIRLLKNVGFLSRCIPISYDFSMETFLKVFESIISEDYHNFNDVNLKFPKTKQEVICDKKFFERLLTITQSITKDSNIRGFRLQKQLQVMIRACALKENRKEVTEEDFNKIAKLSNFINYSFNTV